MSALMRLMTGELPLGRRAAIVSRDETTAVSASSQFPLAAVLARPSALIIETCRLSAVEVGFDHARTELCCLRKGRGTVTWVVTRRRWHTPGGGVCDAGIKPESGPQPREGWRLPAT